MPRLSLRQLSLLRLTRWFLLLVGLAGGFNVGSAVSHCERHAHDMRAGSAVSHSESHTLPAAAWQVPAHSDCPHCPPAECAQVSPCASTATPAIPAAPQVINLLIGQGTPVSSARQLLCSSTHPPLTPPPQLVA
jgi:hypothetical protein